MGKITAIRDGRGRSERVNVFIDGEFAFGLEAEVVVQERLRVGQELSASQTEDLNRSDFFHRCLGAALRYLSYRPRSELEVRERLQRRGFNDSSVDAVMARLREQGLVDDTAFAQFWKANRESFSPRSQRLTKLELRQKGIADDIIDRVADMVNDDESAYRAAQDKARSLPLSDYQGFKRRLGGYLKRRGFNYGVINHTVKRMWQEVGGRFEDGILS